MYDAYKRGLLTPREVYDIKRNDKGQYKILTACVMRAIEDETRALEMGAMGSLVDGI